MLDTISTLLTGDTLKILCDMGHGDTIVLADANFPGETCAKRLVRVPGITATQVLEAMTPLFPLDVAYTAFPAAVMDLTDADKQRGLNEPAAWADYTRVIRTRYPGLTLGKIERFAFYDLARAAYAVIQTGEERIYGNIILTKGCV